MATRSQGTGTLGKTTSTGEDTAAKEATEIQPDPLPVNNAALAESAKAKAAQLIAGGNTRKPGNRWTRLRPTTKQSKGHRRRMRHARAPLS